MSDRLIWPLEIFSTRPLEIGRDQFAVSNNRILLLLAFRRLPSTTFPLLPVVKPIATAIFRDSTPVPLAKAHLLPSRIKGANWPNQSKVLIRIQYSDYFL